MWPCSFVTELGNRLAGSLPAEVVRLACDRDDLTRSAAQAATNCNRMEPIPTVNVYRLVAKRAEIVILHNAPQYVLRNGREVHFANVGFGRLERYAADEFAEQGLAIVKLSLQEFRDRKAPPNTIVCEWDLWSPTQLRKFDATHGCVIVALDPTGRLRLDRMFTKRLGKSAASGRVPARYVGLDATAEQFFAALGEMFMAGK